MIPCISIDGVDGSGKTTLINNLKSYYNVVTLPRFYVFGNAPSSHEERKKWFRNVDAIQTTPIYISGYFLRFMAAEEYKKGFHFKFLDDSLPKLVLIDRGLISLKAFSYASLKKNSDLSNEQIYVFLDKYIDNIYMKKIKKIIDYSVLLFDDSTASLESIISRREYEPEDELLIRYQYEYYLRNVDDMRRMRNVSIVSPFESQYEIIKKTMKTIEEIRNVL